MSIILLATTEINRIGGMASHLYSISSELKNRGWEVHCLTTNNRGDYFDEMSKSYKCYDMSSFPLSPKKVFMAADLANSVMPDIILTNNCALMHYAIPLIDPKIKTISVLHSDDARFYAIGALFSGRVFRWIAPTAGLAARFHKFVEQRLHHKIRVIPHGIDRSIFFPKKTKNDGSARQILFVGFLGESKGADLLPDIFQKVAAAIPDSFLTIIGDGPLKVHLNTEFRKRGLHKRILMQGATTLEETAKIMRASHILLLPTNLEGFGMVIVEAMMCGLVPVASRLRGITDQIVDHAETGFLVAPGDVAGFAEAIKTIHKDENLFRVMSQKARTVAADRFSLASMMDHYEGLFKEPDDRQITRKRSRPGWYAEAVIQFMRKKMK